MFLGDYVDRGPQSFEVVDKMMRLSRDPNVVCLKGNHEIAMARAWRDIRHLDWWTLNGAGPTLLSYGIHHQGRIGDLQDNIPEAHIDWAESLPLFDVDKWRVYVHGGVDDGPRLVTQSEEVMTMKRYDRNDEGGYDGRHVVHGHTPHAEGPMLYKGRTNLDTMAFKTGRLVIGVFDDDKAGGPVDLIEVTDK